MNESIWKQAATSTGTSSTFVSAEVGKVHRRVELTEQRAALVAYMLSKAKANDLHAVQDAASDLREIDARLDELSRT